MALGTKSKRGIYRFGEDDSESSFSELLNLGMNSVHDAIRAFSGTPAERALLTEADVALGSTWTDTDSAARIWRMTIDGWAEIRPGRHYSGTNAERAAFAAPAGSTWRNTDGNRALYSARPSTKAWRLHGGRQQVNPTTPWQVDLGYGNWSRIDPIVIPTVLDAHEELTVTPLIGVDRVTLYEVIWVERRASDTVLSMRVVQFGNAGIVPYWIAWGIAY